MHLAASVPIPMMHTPSAQFRVSILWSQSFTRRKPWEENRASVMLQILVGVLEEDSIGIKRKGIGRKLEFLTVEGNTKPSELPMPFNFVSIAIHAWKVSTYCLMD